VRPVDIAVNRLDVSTVGESIELSDRDSASETAIGLSSITALAPAGSVTITAVGPVVITKIEANGLAGTASVKSVSGNVWIPASAGANAIVASSAIDLEAGLTVRSHKFFVAPDRVEYRGDDLVFNDSTADGSAGTAMARASRPR